MITLRGRLALVNVAVLLIALLLLAVIVLNQLGRDLYEQLDRDLALRASQELEHIEIVDNAPLFIPGRSRSQIPPGPGGFIRLLDARGRVTAGVGAYADAPVIPQALLIPPEGVTFNQTAATGLPLRVYSRPLLAENRVIGYIQVADDLEEIQETLELVRRSLTLGIPLALLVAGLMSLLAARQALRPLTKMTQSAAAISAERLDERLPVPAANDEVQALAKTFNATLDRLEAAFVRQRRFTADASHELRTPVTAILGQAEFALNRPRSPEAYRHALARIQAEAERMQRLIGRMLTLARIETGRQPLALAPADVARLVRSLGESLEPAAAEKGLTLSVEAPASLVMTVDADSLTQILLNLLENAIAYTDQGQVEVSLTAAPGQVQFLVKDTGQGIAPEILPHIFEPFYRADPARSHGRGSVGLGLALTHELVQLLGGTIAVKSQPGQGTTFTLTLPHRA